MAETVERLIKCQECGELLNESSDAQIARSMTCPKCGSRAALIEIIVNESMELHDQIRIKEKDGDSEKTLREKRFGDDLTLKTGEWNSLERLIDHENDWYEETIRNKKTAEIIHHCAERLTDHRDHGSAKRKTKLTDTDNINERST